MFSRHSFQLSAVLLAATALPGAEALAHAVVVKATPPDRAALAQAPEQIVLEFNAKLEKQLTDVRLERAGGGTQSLQDIAPEPAVMRIPLPPDLPAGAYTVHYRVLATDGHATQGVLRFTLDGAP